jgi:hypothetical protein
LTEQPINLNKFRKARERVEKRDLADANAVKFGQTKAQRVLDASRNEKARAMLDRHKMDDEV